MRKPAYVPEDQQCACGCGYQQRKNSKYATDRCSSLVWAHSHPEKKQAGLQRLAESKVRTAERKCTCGRYDSCMTCRNYEKKRAFKAGEIPEYRLKVIAQIVATGD
jgi:hypothetical protein